MDKWGGVTPTVVPTPVPTQTQTVTITPTPNGYDVQTVTPDPYTNIINRLTAMFTLPAANSQFTRGQQVPIRVEAHESGSSSDLCGTWELVKPNGDVVVLTTTDFASDKLPRIIPPCLASSY